MEKNEAVKKMLQSEHGKEKFMQVLKALSAMRLTKEDSMPSLVLSITSDNQLTLESAEGTTPFLY